LLFTVTYKSIRISLPLDFYFFKLKQPLTVSTVQLLYNVKEKGGKPKPYPLPCGLRNPYRNLKSVMNSASVGTGRYEKYELKPYKKLFTYSKQFHSLFMCYVIYRERNAGHQKRTKLETVSNFAIDVAARTDLTLLSDRGPVNLFLVCKKRTCTNCRLYSTRYPVQYGTVPT
jgi:hypothetical protein